MIRHIFLSRARDGVPSSALDELLAAWRGFEGQIPGIVALTAGHHIEVDGRRFSVGLIIDFEDVAAWQGYFDHPAHIAVKTNLTNRLVSEDDRITAQIEIPGAAVNRSGE